ncbi:unnamed protein product [Ambrosiozyma monospora]|uniref:Unnamed protein product n=1 Tax=Ambrosiozyma monospora TaxID=43982 RepID=A0ACB5T4V5_AMBMO|nr:unnamed protein product [Ambrosiozyma monospora]
MVDGMVSEEWEKKESCGLAFPTPEDQRSHMKTDWHRYNLKRRVASLPPINEDLFTKKVASLSINDNGDDSNADKDSKKSKNKQVTKKELKRRQKEELLEKKKKLLELAKQRMVNNNIGNDGYSVSDKSEAPVETEEKKEISMMVEEEKKEQADELTEEQLQEKLMQEKYENRVEIPLENCLFCNKQHDTLENNIDHMFKSHGLYLPEVKYLVDKPGLINYLSEKIGFGNVCLVCHYQGRNLESVRQHMLSKSHCKIPYETEDEKLEISNFYDFTSSYDQVEDGDADEWEDISGDEAGNSDDESDIPEDNLYTKLETRKRTQ